MSKGATVQGSKLSIRRSILNPAAASETPTPCWDAGRDFRRVGTASGSGGVLGGARDFPEDGGAARVRRRAQPTGGGLGDGGRAPAGGGMSSERVGETPALAWRIALLRPGLPASLW